MASHTKNAPALGFVGMLRWAWTQLTKMNTALFLLLLLAVAAVPGSIFPQRIQDPSKVSDYIEAHPTWGPLADKLQLFDVFSSVWFAAIYLLLFISLIGCVIPRSKQHAQALRRPPARTPKNLDRLPVYRSLSIKGAKDQLSSQDTLADAARILKKRGYRVEIRQEEQGGSVGAERGYLREIGNLVFHVAMIAILLGVGIGSLYGYKGQKILVEDETFVNSLLSYDSFTPGSNYNPDWLQPFKVTLDRFTVEYDRQENSPTYGDDLDYTAELTVDESGQQRSETLKVNAPVSFAATNLYLLGNGYAPIIKVENADGSLAYQGPVVGLSVDNKYTSSVVIKVPDAQPDQLGFVGMFLPTRDETALGAPVSIDSAPINPALILESYQGDLGLDDGSPQNVYVLDTANMTRLNSMAQGNGIVLTPENNKVTLPDGHGSITFEGYKRYVGLEVQYDPGKGLVLWSFILAFLGLILSLFVPRRRVWVRVLAQDTGQEEKTLLVEYGLLARGEDPRINEEADKLTDLFAQSWGLELGEASTAS
ncbi:MAG: cytochrome c biogenesis protein ResB [Rothia sp. (in: high G+C Gram-positive bacteria)]|nr:cytochrome c biogenesis protein ResB [Rothia sp. (in: high G+C Gram-positive bacteria)]